MLPLAFATISFRPSKKDLKAFESMLKEEDLGKSDAARDVFELGLKSWRENKALEEFYRGKLSMLCAAEKAGLSVYEFIELLRIKRVPYISISDAELDREMAALDD